VPPCVAFSAGLMANRSVRLGSKPQGCPGQSGECLCSNAPSAASDSHLHRSRPIPRAAEHRASETRESSGNSSPECIRFRLAPQVAQTFLVCVFFSYAPKQFGEHADLLITQCHDPSVTSLFAGCRHAQLLRRTITPLKSRSRRPREAELCRPIRFSTTSNARDSACNYQYTVE
jgi:hypothetical protein